MENVGATNVGRILGRRWGYTCFFLDLLKGFLPSFFAGVLIGTIRLDGTETAVPTMMQQRGLAGRGCGSNNGTRPEHLAGFQGRQGCVRLHLARGFGMFPYFTFPALIAFALWVVVVSHFKVRVTGEHHRLLVFRVVVRAAAPEGHRRVLAVHRLCSGYPRTC